MESTQDITQEILDLKALLIEKNRQETDMGKMYQNVEHFFGSIQEQWNRLKISFSDGQHSPEVVSFSEDLAHYFLDHVDFYFNRINKNHTGKMEEMIGKIKEKLEGLPISEKLKRRLEGTSEDNSLHELKENNPEQKTGNSKFLE